MIRAIKNFFVQLPNQPQPARRVYLFVLILLIGFLGTLLLSAYHLLHASPYYPYVWFLYDPIFLHFDFMEIYEVFANGLHDVYKLDGGKNYLPIGFLLSYPFSFLPQKLALYTLETIFTGGLLFLVYKWLPSIKYRRFFTLLFVFLSFPVLFVLNRGNVEMILFLLMALFVVCYKKEKFYWAGFFLACAIDFKIYPAVFLLLFVSDRRFKELFATLVFTVALLIGGFYLTGGDISSLLVGFQTYSDSQFTAHTLEFSHSLFNLIRIPVFFLLPHSAQDDWGIFIDFGSSVSHYYLALMFFLFAVICVRIIFFNKIPLWQRVFLLSLAQVSFPFVSSNYTLLLLILPLLLFFQEEKPIKNSTLITCLSALLFVPMNIILLHQNLPFHGNFVANIGTIIRPLLLLYLLAVIFFLPTPKDLPYTHK